MNDSDKALYGLTPMTVILDTSLYSNGCFADSQNSIATMVKWLPSPYPNVYKYALYIWKDKPSWYVGNTLYRVIAGSDLSRIMAHTAEEYVLLDPDINHYTFTDLTAGADYYCCVQAIADEWEGYLSDVYITNFTAVYDALTPIILSVVDNDDNFLVSWKPYAGWNPLSYTLYVWHGDQSWYHGEDWYQVSGNPDLSVQLASSSERFEHIDIGTHSVSVSKSEGVNKYLFGVIAWISYEPYAYTNVYIVSSNLLATWKWVPRGEFSQSIDWGTNVIDFETGIKHYQQKFTQPTRIFSATFSGLANTWFEIRDFIDAHKGNLLPFYLWVDEHSRKTRYAVRLAESKFNPKFQTEVFLGRFDSGFARRKIVGFEIELSFIEVKGTTPVVIDNNSTTPSSDDTTSVNDDTTSGDDTTAEDDTTSNIFPDDSDSDFYYSPDTVETGVLLTTPYTGYGSWAYIKDDYTPQTFSLSFTLDTVETVILLTAETSGYGTWDYCNNSDFILQEA